MARWGRPRSCECGECQKCKHADYMRAYYARKTPEERYRLFRAGRDRDAVRARDRERYARMKSDPDYAAKRKARQKVSNALRGGRLERGACEVCGASDAHAHHDDYDKPLEVRWLCPRHHADEHRIAA